MLEVLSKFSGLFKASSLLVFLMMIFSPTNQFETKEKLFRTEDEVPGDNFPYMAMSREF